jgi:RHS repeat-associated protein
VNQNDALNTVYHYGPYGEGTNWTPADALTGNPFRYTGRRVDPETGLYYYRARYYSPAVGRFLQTDPIGTKDDLNLHAYVYNDPIDRTDPSGMCDVVCPPIDVDERAVLRGEMSREEYMDRAGARATGAQIGLFVVVSVVAPAVTAKVVGLGTATGAIVGGGTALATGDAVDEGMIKGAASGAATSIAGGATPGRFAKALAVGTASAATSAETGGDSFESAAAGLISAGVELAGAGARNANTAGLMGGRAVGQFLKSMARKLTGAAAKEAAKAECKKENGDKKC